MGEVKQNDKLKANVCYCDQEDSKIVKVEYGGRKKYVVYDDSNFYDFARDLFGLDRRFIGGGSKPRENSYEDRYTQSYTFTTDAEAMKFITDWVKEMKAKGYEVKAEKIKVVKEDIPIS